MMAQVRATPEDWTWGYHRDPDNLCANRRLALERFLADYDDGRQAGPLRHGRAALAALQVGRVWPRGLFYLLFLYSDLLAEDFHIRAVAELCRVAKEVRIFPLLTLSRRPSPYLAAVQSALRSQGWLSEVVRVDYELQRGGNEMLRVFRP